MRKSNFEIPLILIIFSAFLFTSGYSLDCSDPSSRLIRDLTIVEYWNKRHQEFFPVTYNNFLQGGYINMPSARMGEDGEIGVGYSSVPPYRCYNLRFQLTDILEVTGNYRVFVGIEDPILSPYGFGDLSDKGANIKLALFKAEDSNYRLPGLAVGLDDFMGTRSFKTRYIVATKVFLDYDFELSLGWGGQRIKGLFGGVVWLPFRKSGNPYLKDIAWVAEYDATDYKNPEAEKHPGGRDKKTGINIGLKYRIWDSWDFSLSWVRGTKLAFSASTFYNFGYTKGILPKYDDPLPYRAPINTQPLGTLRPEDVMVQDFVYAFKKQGFEILEIWLGFDDECNKVLTLKVINLNYREERLVREHFDYLLAFLTPSDIDKVRVLIDVEGCPVQEYRYTMEYLRSFGSKEMGKYELTILSPLCESQKISTCQSSCLFYKKRDWFDFCILPNTHTLFGGSKGKFKYGLGITLAFEGYLPYNVYYSLQLGYLILSDLHHVSDVDRLNPSQIINVRSDIVDYYKQRSITVQEAYLQKMWNLGKGFFTRCSVGWFEPEYGGVASEWLYYPVNNVWAVGVEGAVVKKREKHGIGFTNKIRKLDGFVPTYHHFLGSQYFLSVYYDCKLLNLDLKVSAGKFLANDYGVRYEVTRYFPSGLRLTFWYTRTNGHDRINGETYHDKGVAFSMPLDIFYPNSCRERWGYGMSAWLRDVGASAFTGQTLYPIIRSERE